MIAMTDETTNQNHSDKRPADNCRPDLASDTPRANGPTMIDFDQISSGANSLLIRLGNEIYTLRRTQSGKLILNK